METYNVFIIIIILVSINYIHKKIDERYKSNENNLDPMKHDIYKQAIVDFTTIIFLYLIYNKNKLDLTDFFYHLIVGSFGFFIFYHIVQPIIINQKN